METLPPGGPSPQRDRRRILTTGLKIAVTLAGLVLVLTSLDPAQIAAAITGVDWRWLAVGALLIAISLVLRAYRWHVVLVGTGSHIRFSRLVELYLVGSFFNAFLPSGLGGDVVRAAEAAQDVDSGVAVGTVVVDRLSGLMALFGMALLVLPWRPPDFPAQMLALITALCVAGLAAGLLLVDGRLALAAADCLPWGMDSAIGGAIRRTAEAIHRCGWPYLLAALAISIIFNLIQIGWWVVTARALGLDVPPTYFLLVVPILSLALLIPSIGGLGVRETLAPFLFAGAGITPEEAVALSLLVFGLERVASLLGAPVYLASTLRAARGRPAGDDVAGQPRA